MHQPYVAYPQSHSETTVGELGAVNHFDDALHHSSDLVINHKLSHYPNVPHLQSRSAGSLGAVKPPGPLSQVPGIATNDHRLLHDFNGTYPQYELTSGLYNSVANNIHETNNGLIPEAEDYVSFNVPHYSASYPSAFVSGYSVPGVTTGANPSTNVDLNALSIPAVEFDPLAAPTSVSESMSSTTTSGARG